MKPGTPIGAVTDVTHQALEARHALGEGMDRLNMTEINTQFNLDSRSDYDAFVKSIKSKREHGEPHLKQEEPSEEKLAAILADMHHTLRRPWRVKPHKHAKRVLSTLVPDTRKCTCCSMVPSARIKTIHFPEVAVMGGPNRPSYDRVTQQADALRSKMHHYPTTKRKPREKRQAGRLKFLPCIIGIGDPTATYSEQSRLEQAADHRNSSHTSPPRVATTQLKSCLKATAEEDWVPEGINEFKPTVQTCTTDDDTMIEPSLFLACCDEERHKTQLGDIKNTESAPMPDQVAQRPPSTGNDGSERNYALRATKVASVQEIPQEGTTIEITTRPSNHVEGSSTSKSGVVSPAAMALAIMQVQNAHQRASLQKAHRIALKHQGKAWSAIPRQTRRKIRQSRKILMAVDTGANVNTCNNFTSNLFTEGSVDQSDIEIQGVAGSTKTDEKGSISGHVKVEDGTSLLIQHRDVHHCRDSAMNLLSASKLTNQGIRCVFAEKGAEGGSYLLFPKKGGERQRVPLIEKNGLYYLEMEVLYKDTESEINEMVAFLSTQEKRRPTDMALTFATGTEPVAYSVAADLQLWHERLGHTHVASLKLIYRTGGIDDFEIEHDPDHREECQCTTCAMTKAKFKHMPNKPRKFNYQGRPLEHIVSDVKVINADSLAGARYFVTFIDTWSRHCAVYFLEKKSDVPQAWATYLAWARRQGYIVKSILTDNGGEYWSKRTESGELLIDEEILAQFERVCQQNGTGLPIEHIKTPGPHHSDMNPIAERYNRKIMDIANAQMYHAKLGVGFWEWSVRHAVYLINRIPLKFHAQHHGSKTAHELIHRTVASYSRMRTWGCDMYQRIPSGPKSSEPGHPNARKLLYLGVSDDEKAYIGYDVEATNASNEIRHVFDVHFDEDMRNRTNNLRAYDRRRKLTVDQRPNIMNEWDDDTTEAHDHVRSLYNLYEDDTNAELTSSAGATPPVAPGAEGDAPPGTPAVNAEQGSEEGNVNTDKENLDSVQDQVTPEPESDQESVETDSDSDSDEDYISEDDHEETQIPKSSSRSLRRANRSRTDSSMPTSIKRSFSKARAQGPFTEQRLRDLAEKEKIEPSTLIRPPRFHKIGVYDKNRPQHLLEADRTFLRAAQEHDYKIIVNQSYDKRPGSISAHRYNLVKPATSIQEYIELSTASARANGGRTTIAKATAKARQDFKYEYDRGLIKFPDRESGHHAHYCDAEELAALYKVERVADTISQNQSNYYANIATNSFNQLMMDIYHVQEAVDWIETKEKSAIFGRKAMEAFITRAPSDLSTVLTDQNLEPDGLDPKTHITPNHYGGAKKSKDHEQWEKAMEEELTNCAKMGTWDLIPMSVLPPNADLVDCRWVYKIKTTSSGDISRWRARIVARGYSQRPGIDYNEEEVYAPVVSYDTLRTCLSIATATDYPQSSDSAGADLKQSSAEGAKPKRGLEIRQADIKNAYLIGTLDSPIYMRQPPSGQMQYDSKGRPLICKLHRPLYGLKQSGHIFASVLHTFLCEDLQMKKLISDKCAFIKDGNPSEWENPKLDQTDHTPSTTESTTLDPNGTQLIVLTYVDDLTIIGTHDQVEWIMTQLRARFTLQDLETGEIEFILSMAIRRDREAGTLTLNQQQAIEKIAEKMEITTTNSVDTAMVATPLVKLVEPETDPSVANWPYLETVGSLLHISQCTRPDIAYAVGSLARHSTTLGKQHIRAAKRCVQYLYNTRELCIRYSADHDINDVNEPEVYEAGRRPEAFADADYAGESNTRKSTSGGIIFLNGGPITWSSKLQKIVAQSTAEAEIISATEITKEIVHLKLLLAELGARQDKVITVHEDNQACILMGNNMKSSRSAKHYEIRLHFLQHSIRSEIIKFKYCPTDVMIADALTKPLESVKFLYFRDKMLTKPL